MSNLATILQYQETDKKLFALEKELSSCEERKEFVKAKKFLENAAEKLDSLEMKARTLKEKAAEIESRCGAIEKDLADLSGIDELIEGAQTFLIIKKRRSNRWIRFVKRKRNLPLRQTRFRKRTKS